MIPGEVLARWADVWPRETIPARFGVVCAAHAGRVAVVDTDVRIGFSDLAARVERLAGALAGLGAGPGAVVSWQLPNWWEAVVVHHAALRAGAVPNPLDPALRARELRAVLAEARSSILVVPRAWRGFDHAALAAGLGVPVVIVARGSAPGALELDALLDTPAPAAPAPPDDPAGLALLLYTSGTTSGPKGVLHTHRGLLWEIETFRTIHGLGPKDRYLGGAPVSHIAGLVYGVLAPFALGTSTAFLDRWVPARALELIASEGATFQTGPPTFLQTLAEGAGGDARAGRSSFRLFSTGGANIPTDLVREAGARLGCVVKRAYGSTEVPTLTATTPDDDEAARVETDGRPIAPAEMRIVRADGADAPPGEHGEIWARAPEMLAGYRDPALDAAALAPGGWFRTGDLGVVDERGLLHVSGRLKDIIIRGGENIGAKEIEDLLSEHPAVVGAAVVGMPDPRLGERVCVFVELRDGARLGFEEMVAHLRAREIATHKLPERLEILPALPRTPSGKVRKDELRARLG